MPRVLNVHLLSELADPHDLAGCTAVVIDVLRASTTITTALAAGASAVLPCLDVAEARRRAAERPGSLLGGERGGRRIEGFDLGNSPAEYTAQRVADRTIVFTTTNGTKALMRCTHATHVLVGCLANCGAVCQAVASDDRVDLICAGTDGAVSLEDAVAAGAMASRLLAQNNTWRLNDAALLCHEAWASRVGEPPDRGRVVAMLKDSRGGKNLIEIGMEDDLPRAAELDRYRVVPVLRQSRELGDCRTIIPTVS